MNYFNSRSREESDSPMMMLMLSVLNFNSRSREESDVLSETTVYDFNISILALAKRATLSLNLKFSVVIISILALAKRATSH